MEIVRITFEYEGRVSDEKVDYYDKTHYSFSLMDLEGRDYFARMHAKSKSTISLE